MRILLVLLLAITSHGTYACKCWGSKILNEKIIVAPDLIVKGRVIHIDTIDNQKILHIRIIKKYKGSEHTSNNSIVIIKTDLDTGRCGLDVQKNQTWLLLAYRDYKGFSTDRCSRSQNLNDVNKVVRALGTRNIQFLERRQRKNSKIAHIDIPTITSGKFHFA